MIAGFGGINPAGRSSGFLAFRRLVLEALSAQKQTETYLGLASLMGLTNHKEGGWVLANGQPVQPGEVEAQLGEQIRNGTLLRRLESNHFEADLVPYHKSITLKGGTSFELEAKDLPIHRPAAWKVEELGSGKVKVEITGGWEFLQPDHRKSLVQTAGQLPTGFNPGALYNSNHHPRGLMMALYGASDCLGNGGFGADDFKKWVRPEEIAVYSASAMSQLDDLGLGGYMKAPYLGKRSSSKQMPFSLAEMPADFINAYVLGSVGRTGGILGACASLLYNLDAAARDIQSGKTRIAMVGMSEAPLVPEVFEGYRVMSALAEDDQVLALDKHLGATQVDHRRACRPFGQNCGFTLAESAQYFILMDDQLAFETGAKVYGSVGGVFIAADGIKKSISSPGAGNYVTLAQAAALTRAILGEQGLKRQSYVHAHGTGTPQNRVTESHGLNQVAKAFGVEAWPVIAAKCYLGHSIGTAAGDQIMTALGAWAEGVLPGIFTLDQLAGDVHHSNLSFSQKHRQFQTGEFGAALVNSKGFGGNNATGVFLSPEVTLGMMAKKQGAAAFAAYQKRTEATEERISAYQTQALLGQAKPIYRFGEPVIEGEDLELTDRSIRIPGFVQEVDLNLKNPFGDMAP